MIQKFGQNQNRNFQQPTSILLVDKKYNMFLITGRYNATGSSNE